MTRRFGRLVGAPWALALAVALAPCWAQEQPAAGGVTMEQLSEAIQAYVHDQEKKGGGAWKLEDPVAKTTLELTLVRVNEDKLSRTAPDAYFACVYLQGTDGHFYDVDVFMKGPDKEHLKLTEVSIHKKGRKERYAWREERGVWKRVPVVGDET